MKQAALLCLIIWTVNSFAQDTSGLTLSGYADAYYSWYSNAEETALQQHDCIGAYHNNLGLNIAQLSAAYRGDRVRGTATFHFGDIPAITWADDYRQIQEANAGVRLAKGLWLDAGFFKTHVGTESFLPKDNLLSIISLGTFYGPFYQSGARLSYTTESNWHFEAHVINGYNRHIDNNDGKSFGVLVSKQFSDNFFMSYSNLLGNEQLVSVDDEFLIYQNLYVSANLGERLELQVGMDVALDDQGSDFEEFSSPLLAPLLTVKYHMNDRFAVAVRGEVFSDESGVNSSNLIPQTAPTLNPNVDPSFTSFNFRSDGHTIYGATLGFEYKPSPFGFLRVESRMLYRDVSDLSFPDDYSARFSGLNPMLDQRVQVMATLGVLFNRTFTLKA